MDQKICHGKANASHRPVSGCRCLHTGGRLTSKLLTDLMGHEIAKH